jgi:hypothetical protein
MSATFVLPVTSLLYAVGANDSSVVLSTSATSTNGVGTVSSLSTAPLIQVGYGLWVDQELMKVVGILSDPVGLRYQVLRGQAGSSSQSHSSTAQVTIGQINQFYLTDPKGKPENVVLVSPWINTVNGQVWFPQGDASPDNTVRWWQNVTNTYGVGPVGVRTQTSNPTYGT